MPGRAGRIPFEFAKTGNFGRLFDIVIMKIIENFILWLKSPPDGNFLRATCFPVPVRRAAASRADAWRSGARLIDHQ
jgi:hypothetical protein